jgi:hypothetical protein
MEYGAKTVIKSQTGPAMSITSSRASLLLLCRVLSGNSKLRESAIAELSDAARAAAIVALAQTESVLPAFYNAIADFPECLPKSERIALAMVREANRRRNHQIRDAVTEIAGEADRHSMPVVVLKGARWVVEDAAGFAAWRSMLDVDLLVRVEDYRAMRPILEGLGYRSVRREHNFLGQPRFAGHYHLVALRRDNHAFVTEVHRHVQWQPALLPTESIFDNSQVVAPGLRLPCPWHAVLHAIIHWQIHHYGYQLGFNRVTDGLDIARFLGRNDVDFGALADHVARVGIRREVDAALATVTELFGVPLPAEFHVTAEAKAYVARALQTRRSRLLKWRAKQHQRIIRLWYDHRFVYRSTLRNEGPAATRAGLWALRVRRLPFLISHLVSIALLDAVSWLDRAFRGENR